MITVSKEFITAGKATFTVHNDKGEHYTYRITKKEYSWGFLFFIGLLTGPDNESSYTYMGALRDNKCGITKASKMSPTSLPVQVFNWAMSVIAKGKTVPEGYGILHEGHCGRCGRTLTTPESIERGIGPECAQIMGII